MALERQRLELRHAGYKFTKKISKVAALGAPLYLGLFEAVTHPYFEIIGGGGDAKKYWLTGLPRPERS